MGAVCFQQVVTRQSVSHCSRHRHGLIHSGEVADAAYFHLSEKGRMDNSEYVAKYQIDVYWRFKDDALLVVNVMDLAKDLSGKL